MIEKKLPSGASLKINIAPFADAKAMFQACVEEMKALRLSPQDEIDVNFRKDLFCAAIGSKKIELAVWKCFERALYNDLKIEADTFEAVDARQDYIEACFHVAKENIAPFVKSLSAEFAVIMRVVLGKNDQA